MRRRLPVNTLLLARGAKTFGKGISIVASNLHRIGWLPGDGEVDLIRDVPYTHRGGKQSVDVYLPRRADANHPLPFAFFVHGGGWVIGDRKLGSLMGRNLASRGIAVVTPGYRLAPTFGIHEQLDDLKRALRFTLDAAPRWKLDPSRFAVIGESAGSHLAMRLLQTFPDVTRPKAVVGFYGPYDLALYLESSLLREFLSTIGQGGDVEELVKVHGALRELPWNDVPVFLIHGGADRFVPVENSIAMKAILERQGVAVELKIYPGSGHGFNYQNQINPHHTADSYRELVRFFRRHVGA